MLFAWISTGFSQCFLTGARVDDLFFISSFIESSCLQACVIDCHIEDLFFIADQHSELEFCGTEFLRE